MTGPEPAVPQKWWWFSEGGGHCGGEASLLLRIELDLR